MEVGIEDCLHLQFAFEKSKFHLKDVIIGRVHFDLVKIKIRTLEMSLIKKETVGSGNSSNTESETLSTYEIMDGGPAKGESVPIRFYLSSTEMTPTYKKVNNRFSCRYYINLTFYDDEDRKYFKS